MSQKYQQLECIIKKDFAYNVALSMLNWDNSTLAPPRSMELTADAIGLLSMESYHLTVNPQVEQLLEDLQQPEEYNSLMPHQKNIVKKMYKSFRDMKKIPADEIQQYSQLCAIAGGIWENAKINNDYASYKDTLSQIIEYQKRFATYSKAESQSIYDYILDMNEEGFTCEILDAFFDKLRKGIVPLIKKINENGQQIDDSFLKVPFDLEKQKQFCRLLAKHIGFDFDRGVMAESAHPFTMSFHNRDVRITNHYYEEDPTSSFFSAIHEGGHALYEFDIDDCYNGTAASSPSMGAHESQSRLYENNLGRSKAFWEPLYETLVSYFPAQLKDVSLDTFHRAINKSQPSLIRTQADELTYSLHVMIRYEIEREIFQGTVSVDELPALWNQKYEEYLGICPKNDSEGILQDSHWSFGGFGYFPSYAIGSAIAAQLMHTMKKEMDIDRLLQTGNLEPIHQFLQEHIHQYGGTKTVNEFLLDTTGEGFEPNYYIEYLTQKYSCLYNI